MLSLNAEHLTGKILSFYFYPKAVYFEGKFWISRLDLKGQIQGKKTSKAHYLKISACEGSLLYMQNASLKV